MTFENFEKTFKKTNYSWLMWVLSRHPASKSITNQKWVTGKGSKLELPVKRDEA